MRQNEYVWSKGIKKACEICSYFLFQDIVVLLEDQLSPLVQAELSVLVDVLHQPDLLFPAGTEERKKCESGGFISRSVFVFTPPFCLSC